MKCMNNTLSNATKRNQKQLNAINNLTHTLHTYVHAHSTSKWASTLLDITTSRFAP